MDPVEIPIPLGRNDEADNISADTLLKLRKVLLDVLTADELSTAARVMEDDPEDTTLVDVIMRRIAEHMHSAVTDAFNAGANPL